MSSYAEGTDVPVEKSRAEIETILSRYGADQFMYGWQEKGAVIAFRAHARHIRFVLPLPDRKDQAFTRVKISATSTKPATSEQTHKRYEQACRQRWRALTLCIKAKLEAVASGISLFEDEFLSNIVMPDGKSLGEHVRPQIARAYETGKMPPLLGHFQ